MNRMKGYMHSRAPYRQDRKRVGQELVKESEKDAMRTCLDESDRTGYERRHGFDVTSRRSRCVSYSYMYMYIDFGASVRMYI